MPIFLANLVAALLVSIFAALAGKGGLIGPGGKLLLVTGVMGGLSTFSSFVWGTDLMLVNPAERAGAIFYLLLSMVSCSWSWVFGSACASCARALRRQTQLNDPCRTEH